MSRKPLPQWVRAALPVGVLYFAIGRIFAWPTFNVQFFRLMAWALSFVGYFSHIGYEHFRLRSTVRANALHVAAAVAIGGFLLAVNAMIYNIRLKGASVGPSWIIALIAWPALTGIPAFIGALVSAWVLARIANRAHRE